MLKNINMIKLLRISQKQYKKRVLYKSKFQFIHVKIDRQEYINVNKT